MADIHVIDGRGESWRIVMHFAVPAGNNAVGVAWSTALINSGLVSSTQLPNGGGTEGTITTAETSLITAGTVYEHTAEFLLETGGTTTAELLATLRAFYAAEKTRVLADLQSRLRYFGYTAAEA